MGEEGNRLRASYSCCWTGVFLCLSFASLCGQVSQLTPVSQQNAPVLSIGQSSPEAFQQEQATLSQQRQALIAQGATQEQLAAWRKQNAAQFASIRQRAQALSGASALQLRPIIQQPPVPANASQTLKDFVTTQVTLANARAQIHNQLVGQLTAAGTSPTSAQISQMVQRESQLFRQQHASDWQLQRKRAQAWSDASAQTPLPVPGPAKIPPNATPQMAAFLTARNQLVRSRIQLMNQYANATPTQRQAAMAQWRQQNVLQVQRLRAQAQNLQANQ